MDADGLTFACATTAEERVARRAGLRAVRIGVRGAAGLPDGELVSFGLAGALHDGLRVGELLDATRVVDSAGATLWEGGPLGVPGARAATVLGSDVLVHDASERRRLHEASGADAVDMESGVLARERPTRRRRPRDLRRSGERCRRSRSHRARRRQHRRRRPAAVDRREARRSDPLDARRTHGPKSIAGVCSMSGRVLLAAPRSFCAGVDRAIEIVERLLEQHGAPVYVRHQIVHNEHVVRRLEALGAVFVEDESEIPEGEFCVLSAHGVAPSVKENAQARGLKIVDATCPLVNKVHAEARRYADSGHLVALVGHANHVEVIGTLGERPDDTVVIESPEQARALKTDKPVAVITQTTLSLDDVAPIVDALGENVGGSLRRPHHDDICYATQNRQDAVKAMVEQGATLILVIGSENSSNAQRLVEVAQAAGATATLVDGESSFGEELLAGHEVVGLTAGASTPEELVRATAERLALRGYPTLEEITVAREDVHFRLPREVARA